MRDTPRTPPPSSEPPSAHPPRQIIELVSYSNSNRNPSPASPTSGLSSPPQGNLQLAPTLQRHPHLPRSCPNSHSLRDHKRSIAVIWTLLALDAAMMPLAFFFPLWYDTDLSPAYIFAVISALFGIISGIEWAFWSWLLWKKEELRPFGGKRNGFDFFHISYSAAYGISLVELIVGAAPHRPFIRLCAMPAPSFILFVGGELLLFSIFQAFHISNPLQISSQEKGAPARPGTYMIVEDVMSVDTSVGRAYRKAMNDRYEASPMFRHMLHQLNLFWAIPALCVGAAVTAAVVNNKVPQTVAYGIGWGVPPLWVGIWVLITIQWVQVALKREKAAWNRKGGD